MTESAKREDVLEKITTNDIQQRSGAGPQSPYSTRPETKLSPIPSTESQASLKANSVLLLPSVRHLLKEMNLNVADIQGTGKNGRVMKEDVHRHTLGNLSSPSKMSSDAAAVFPAAGAKDRLVSLTATQNAMFKTMSRSLTIPHFLYTQSVDLTTLNSLRKRYNINPILQGPQSSKLSVLPFIMKALSHAFDQFPLLNSHLDTESDYKKPQIVLKSSHNFGIAVDTPQGLLVPVVKDVQNHSVSSLAVEIQRLSRLAQEGKLGVEDFKGATFVVSNIGSIGGEVVSPVIVAPMVGIVGVGRMRLVPAFGEDEMGTEKIVKREEVVLSWSADHRVLDGATVAKCAGLVKRLLEDVDVLAVLLR